MPPILTEEPPNNSGESEPEQDMQAAEENSPEDMDEEEEDSVEKDFEEIEGRKNRSL